MTRPLTLLALAAALALAGACKKDDDGDGKAAGGAGKTAAATESQTPPAVSGEQLIKVIDGCITSVETWDKEAVRGCYGDKAEVVWVDNIPPSGVDNREAAVVHAGSIRNAFADYKSERSAILVNGNKAAAVTLLTGVHKNPSIGIPPTGKPISLIQIQVAEYDPQGKIIRARHYVDFSTLLHQLGVVASASAIKSEKSWTPIRVVARNDAGEKENLAVVQRGLEELGKSNVKGALAMYAPDATFRYVPQAVPGNGISEIEQLIGGYVSLSTGFQLEVADAWAAGDWVVVEMTARGSLAEDLPGWKGSKGKKWQLSSADLFRLAGGKVKEHWSFANGLKFAFDVGIFDPAILMGM